MLTKKLLLRCLGIGVYAIVFNLFPTLFTLASLHVVVVGRPRIITKFPIGNSKNKRRASSIVRSLVVVFFVLGLECHGSHLSLNCVTINPTICSTHNNNNENWPRRKTLHIEILGQGARARTNTRKQLADHRAPRVGVGRIIIKTLCHTQG